MILPKGCQHALLSIIDSLNSRQVIDALQEYANWEASLRRVVAVNLNPAKGWWAALNPFSGMSVKEFMDTKMGGRYPTIPSQITTRAPSRRELLQNPPAAFSWVDRRQVTPVKNQESVRNLL